jgi:hypothetical protein
VFQILVSGMQDATRGERLPEPVAVITVVGNQVGGGPQRTKHQASPAWSLIWSFGEHEHKRLAVTVADGMQLRARATSSECSVVKYIEE